MEEIETGASRACRAEERLCPDPMTVEGGNPGQ